MLQSLKILTPSPKQLEWPSHSPVSLWNHPACKHWLPHISGLLSKPLEMAHTRSVERISLSINLLFTYHSSATRHKEPELHEVLRPAGWFQLKYSGFEGLPWWSSGWESTCHCRGHRFWSLVWKDPTWDATGQLNPCAATTEACAHYSLCSAREATATGSPCVAMKTQGSQK